MSKGKIILISISSLIGLIALTFILELVGLSFFKFFEPKKENIRREVFENTKSYTHGKIQDLAKYYEEYQKAETMEDKEAIASLIKIRFAEFNASHINTIKLRQFLISIRGY